ncbi:MAG: T9SS type A sorting domain-containing protein [Cytophagaceae bacterium]|jgi:hypothetical protein|nr:T9SS type A sorting domain-containing protein [Cytophagaceae bacterium]
MKKFTGFVALICATGFMQMSNANSYSKNDDSSLKAAMETKMVLDSVHDNNLNQKRYFEYDAYGNVTSFIRWQSDGSGGFEGSELSEYEYDANGNRTKHLVHYWVGGEWKKSTLAEYAYDANRNETLYSSCSWSATLNDWKKDFKNERAYDENGNMLLDISYMGDANNEWKGSQKNEYTCYENGKRATAILSVWDNGAWKHSTKWEYSYDEHSNPSLNISSNWLNGEWTEASRDKHEYEYNDGEKVTLDEYFEWDYNAEEWILLSKQIFDYDTNGNQTLQEIYYFDMASSAWVGTRKIEFVFDEHGSTIETVEYRWDAAATDWLLNTRTDYTYEYNADGLMILQISVMSYYDGSDWIELPTTKSKIEREYDSNGNETLFVRYSWNAATGEWRGASKIVKEYDLDYTIDELIIPEGFAVMKNMLVTEIYNLWSFDVNSWGEDKVVTYYWIEKDITVAIEDVPFTVSSISVFPNPAAAELHVKLASDKAEIYAIYNNAGQMVTNGTLRNGSIINVELLPAGFYYLKVAEQVVKVIKK